MPERKGYEPNFSLESIRGFNNPNIDIYRKLIERQEGGIGRPNNEPYAEAWLVHFSDEGNRERLNFLNDRLRQQVLADLGSGLRILQNLAKRCKVKAYIGVDRFHGNPGQFSETDFGVKEDLLLFCASLQNDSCNFTLNGIDTVIIPNKKYHEYLAAEIVRATRPGGVIFGVNSASLGNIRKKKGISQIKTGSSPDYYQIYQKE